MSRRSEGEIGGRRRVAVLVGCNYANTPHELHGCINDVVAMRETLVGPRFGFDPSDVQVLTDAPDSAVQPTGKNIKSALRQIVREARDGDVLYFHYSGHGTVVPHPLAFRRKDQAIVPSDFNLITDVDFRELVNGVPKGASLTILSDSCHSGGLIDKEKEQIGPATSTSSITTHVDETRRRHIYKSRWIPFESVVLHLASISGLASSHVGDHLSHLFGEDASPGLMPTTTTTTTALGPDEGILLSGCQADETSADMAPGMTAAGKSYGAFSHAVLELVENNQNKSDQGASRRRVILTNRELVTLSRRLLTKQGFHQHPCLYCSDRNADAPFLHLSLDY